MQDGEQFVENPIDENFHLEMGRFEKIGMEISMHAKLEFSEFEFAMKMLSTVDNALLRFAGAFSLNQIMKEIR